MARSSRRSARPTAARIAAWEVHGLAVNRGRPCWDIERQVRLVAGSIVLSSVLASLVVPKIKWLAAGIGGGLTFAAVSDTCAMGMLLAKLPYNRGASCDAESIVAELSSAATPADADPVQSTAVR